MKVKGKGVYKVKFVGATEHEIVDNLVKKATDESIDRVGNILTLQGDVMYETQFKKKDEGDGIVVSIFRSSEIEDILINSLSDVSMMTWIENNGTIDTFEDSFIINFEEVS